MIEWVGATVSEDISEGTLTIMFEDLEASKALATGSGDAACVGLEGQTGARSTGRAVIERRSISPPER